MLAECVVNISEGRRAAVIEEAVAAASDILLDRHTDVVHNRSVLTLGGPLPDVEEAARRVVAVAVARIDLGRHEGVHPRFGAADVVPFVDPGAGWAEPAARRRGDPRPVRPLGRSRPLTALLPLRAGALPPRGAPDGVRVAAAGRRPDRAPPDRRRLRRGCPAGAGGLQPLAHHRGPPDDESGTGVLPVAKTLAAELRGPERRALGLPLPGGAQVSVNVIGPGARSLAGLYDTVATRAAAAGCALQRAELVGLVPERVLQAAPRHRWAELDLGEDRTIESRLAAKGYQLTVGRE